MPAHVRSRPSENGLHFPHAQVREQTRLGFLEVDRQDPADSLQRRWLAIFQEVQEGFDGGQPAVPGTRAVAARRFQMLQEVGNKWCIDRLYR